MARRFHAKSLSLVAVCCVVLLGFLDLLHGRVQNLRQADVVRSIREANLRAQVQQCLGKEPYLVVVKKREAAASSPVA